MKNFKGNIDVDKHVTEIVKIMLREFLTIPLKVDGALVLAHHHCGVCKHGGYAPSGGHLCEFGPFQSAECNKEYVPNANWNDILEEKPWLETLLRSL